MQFTFKKFLLGLIIALAAVFVSQEASLAKNKKTAVLEVNFLDVGQGDATLINYLGEYQILIDGGPNGKKLLSELGKVMPWGDKNIEIVVLTHPDADHLLGLIDVLDNYQTKIFVDNGQEAETDIYRQLKDKITSKNIEKEAAFEGSNFNIGDLLDFAVLNPDEKGSDSDRNDSSLVIRMDFGRNSFLFTGDAETTAEKDMIFDEENIDTDWLKVGHHGSKTATSEEFLDAVTPQYAVISVGADNRYGHPNEETLTRLVAKNIQVLRTDEMGTIKIGCENPNKECAIR